MKFKLGCDPEVFMADLQGNLKSSVGLIGGSKAFPLDLPLGKGFAVQEDNVAMEFNIPPASGAEEYVSHIKSTLDFLSGVIKNRYGFQIINESAASFPESELQSDAALNFGCDPDYNVWTGKKNPRPEAEDKTLRSCGGHIHIGLEDVNTVNADQLGKAMDMHLGIGSVLMDKGDKRKLLYGKAGAVRYKPYGLEYRTLSNFWIFDDRLIEWVWRNTERAISAVEAQFPFDEYRDSIVNTINNNDKRLAQEMVSKFGLEVIHV
jgi:hypothetical protein